VHPEPDSVLLSWDLLQRGGIELHLIVRLVRTRLAVVADMYLKKLYRSWVLYLERRGSAAD
jgi:hypothetical protein